MIKMQSKIKAKEITKYWKINMMKIDPGAIGSLVASLKSISILRWVNELLLSN